MKKDVLVSPVDGKVIELDAYNRWQLRDIHYQEEIKMAKKILELPPFSKERSRLLNEGYTFVEALKLRYEKPAVDGSFGATPVTVKLVAEVVKERLKTIGNKQLVYEAGVGMGYAIRDIIEIPGIRYYGCDVALFPEVRAMCNSYKNLFLNERTLYEDLLEMKDNSIDVFYADNVIEHLLPDEADEIFKVLYRKIKRKGQLILFIPNWHNGPHDVSMYYLKRGNRATGFHFMEMSYGETIKFACGHGFKANYIIRSRKVEKDIFGIKNLKRILTEQLISEVKSREARLELIKYDNYGSYVFSK